MRSAKVLTLGIILAAVPAVHAQTKPGTAAPTPAKPAANAAAKPAPQTAAKPGNSAPSKAQAAPAGGAAKPAPAKAAPGKQASKRSAKSAVKTAAKKPVEQPASTETAAAGEGEPAKGSRRDPFESLVASQQRKAGLDKILPPGKAGLQVSTLRLDGIVKSTNGMIAVVSNPQLRTYFLREGDQLYDGRVEKIAMDGVSFHEVGKDAFGKPVERQVQKRIYSSTPGEQQ